MVPFHLHDNRQYLSSGRLSAYFSQLFIQTGSDYFQYCILDTEKNDFISLADYRAETGKQSSGTWSESIRRLIASDEILNRKYPSVLIAIDVPYHTVIPEALFDPGCLQDHFQLNYNVPEDLEYKADHLKELNAWNAFATEKDWTELMKKHFSQEIIIHSTTPLLTRFSLIHRQNPVLRQIFLHFSGKRFDIAIFSDNMLLFFNSFQFETIEDVLYFTLYAAEQLKIRTNESSVRICGDIEDDSDLVKLLKEYFRELAFLGRPEGFKYNPLFDFPAHCYQSLFSLALCGS
jgi:hypothetical protein